MPLTSTFMKRSGCLVPHQRGRYGCPLAGSEEACPVDHPNWEKKGGCLIVLPILHPTKRNVVTKKRNRDVAAS